MAALRTSDNTSKRKTDSMSIGYGARPAQPFNGAGASNFGALAMFHAISSAPTHSVPAPSSAPSGFHDIHGRLPFRHERNSVSVDPDRSEYRSCAPYVVEHEPSTLSHRWPPSPAFSPTQKLMHTFNDAFQTCSSASPQMSNTSIQPPTPSLLARCDEGESPTSASEASAGATSLPFTTVGIPSNFCMSDLSVLCPEAALEGVARMRSSQPSWEMCAHTPGEAPTADPSQLVHFGDLSAESLTETNKRKRALSRGIQPCAVQAYSVPPPRLQQSLSLLAPQSQPFSCSTPIPVASASPPKRSTNSLRTCPKKAPVDEVAYDRRFGSSDWVPPPFTKKEVDWDGVESAIHRGQLPPITGVMLEQSFSPRKRPRLLPSQPLRDEQGNQPHLDRLRHEVVSGARPDLALAYLDKLRPKSNLTKVQEAREGAAPSPPPRLSKAEKKANHLASEHKRRQNIRKGYQDLASIVPSLQHLERDDIKVGISTENMYLHKTIAYMRQLIEDHAALLDRRDTTMDKLQQTYGVDLLILASGENHNMKVEESSAGT